MSEASDMGGDWRNYITLSAQDLVSKFGFYDGDMPEQVADAIYGGGISGFVDWEATLKKLVRERLLPLLPGVEVYDIDTAHNPIRADHVPSHLLDVEVVVPVADVIASLAEARAGKRER